MNWFEALERASNLRTQPEYRGVDLVVRKIGHFYEIEQYGPGKFWRILPSVPA